MKPIRLEVEMVAIMPDAYINKDTVGFSGIDGQERFPWQTDDINQLLMELLNDESI